MEAYEPGSAGDQYFHTFTLLYFINPLSPHPESPIPASPGLSRPSE
jgi:hypothetical protein